MSSESSELDPSELVPSIGGSGFGEEFTVKAKLGWGYGESPSPWLKEDSSSGSVLGSEDIPYPDVGSATNVAGDRSSPIVVEEYPLVETFRRLVTCCARKPRSSLFMTETSGSEVPKIDVFLLPSAGEGPLHPPKGEVSISFWAMEFGLRLPIQPFFEKLLVNLRMASIQLSPNFWRYVSGCYVLWQEQGWEDPLVEELRFLFNMNAIFDREGLHYIRSWNSSMTPRSVQ
ncbi:hypothetical protein ACOSQ2_025097 [Xanthoceras sorbifolium]